MPKRAFFVVGAERSGTRFLTRLLIEECGCVGSYDHGQLMFEESPLKVDFNGKADQIAFRRSMPHAGYWDVIRPVVQSMRESGYEVTALVPVRDWNVCIKSQIGQRFARDSAHAIERLRRAQVTIFPELLELQVPFFVVNYEALGRPGYREWLYGILGLQATSSVPFEEGNSKYYGA